MARWKTPVWVCRIEENLILSPRLRGLTGDAHGPIHDLPRHLAGGRLRRTDQGPWLCQPERGGPGCAANIANLSYVYNHHERELAERLAAIQHAHHDLTISTMHAHLDHEQCIETALLKGPVQQVREFSDAIIAERGVRHGKLNLISVELGAPHSHGGRTHRHLSPSH